MNNITDINNNYTNSRCNGDIKVSPNFKAGIGGLLNTSGNIMQSIENSGFLGSFLIQDFCGMTIPRTTAGFLRDKEHTGKYNMQEGFEVLGREGLTGPCMMAVAPLALLLAAKFGKTTSLNSDLIKRFGNSLKEILGKSEFKKEMLNDAEKFKEYFYKKNISKILEDTLGKNNFKEENIEYIFKQIQNIEKVPPNAKLSKFRGKSKYKNQCFNNITEYINDLVYKNSNELNMLEKVKFGSEKLDSKKVFSTKNTIDAMIKYSDDAITANKHLDKLDEIEAEKIKDKALGKRLITNISMIASTLGILSVLPKIYARSNVAPGAIKKEKNEEISFKGKNNKSLIEKIGSLVNKNKSDFVSKELEYNGHNFTNTLMAGLSIFGLLTPRGLRAYNRAQKDENGKKDLTELWEILIRDVSSSLAVVFAVPMLTRSCVTSYEKHSGFVLMDKDRSPKSRLKNFLDLINPYSSSKVLSNSEINSLYNKIDSKEKMLNFCEFIDKNGGDLEKILSKSKNNTLIFNSTTTELNQLKNIDKKAKNTKIKQIIKSLEGDKTNELISKMMEVTKSGKAGKITAFAKGLTSVPAILTTFLISPYLLGWAIPRLTYANTRRIHEKQKENSLNKSI